MSNKEIYQFAVKWCDKFRNRRVGVHEIIGEALGEECARFRFEMDIDKEDSLVWIDAIDQYEKLNQLMYGVNDVQLLGSIIYARWKTVKSKLEKGEEIFELNERAWFFSALCRLAILAGGKNPFLFTGTPQKLYIVSNNICYGRFYERKDEVEQHIAITAGGDVSFVAYTFGEGDGRYEKSRTKHFTIKKEVAENVLQKVGAYFSEDYEELFATDVGSWQLEITNTEGETFLIRGSLCENLIVNGMDLSDLIRDVLNMDDLFVFDGNCKKDKIMRITVKYHRVTKIEQEQAINENLPYVIWDYTEQLVMDRETDTIEHVQKIGTNCIVTRKYEVEDGVSGLLDEFEEDGLFEHIVGNPPDVIETPNETKHYTIKIEYERNPPRTIEGTFDKNGLPEDWGNFARAVFRFMNFYGFGEIFNHSIYNKRLRRADEYIFCSVIFDSSSKSYYYITDDDSIEEGDLVIVPVGKDNHHEIVEVVDVEYFTYEDAPYPVDQTKRIIRKWREEDYLLLNDDTCNK